MQKNNKKVFKKFLRNEKNVNKSEKKKILEKKRFLKKKIKNWLDVTSHDLMWRHVTWCDVTWNYKNFEEKKI